MEGNGNGSEQSVPTPRKRGSVGIPLNIPNLVGISLGAATWPKEQDIAPEILLAEMIPMESNAFQPPQSA